MNSVDRTLGKWLEALGAIRSGAFVLVFCGIMLWLNPHFFWNDDCQIGTGAGLEDIARAWSQGEYPLLSPYSWVSGNIAGEYGGGTFSIFLNACIVLIWKLPLSLAGKAAAISMAHLFVLAAGSHLLARQRGLRPALATMVALVAALNGWIIGWAATDWLGALFGCAWLPWAWWALNVSLRSDGPRWRWILPSGFIYLIVSAGWHFTVLMLVLLSAWLAVRTLCETRRIVTIWPIFVSGICGFGLAAPSWMMLIEHTRGSGRTSVGAALQMAWIVPVRALLGLIVPDFSTPWRVFSNQPVAHVSIEMACGLVPAVALLGALIFLRGKFVRKFGWELLLLAVVFAFAASPGAGVFRWSFRWLPMMHLVLALVGAEACEALWTNGKLRNPLVANPGMWAALLVAVGCGIAWGSQGTSYRFAIGFELLAACAIWALATRYSDPAKWIREWMPAAVAFAVFVSTYVHIPTTLCVPIFNISDNQLATGPLDPHRTYFSIYERPDIAYTAAKTPPGFGALLRPGVCSMYAGLRFLNGYSVIVPRGVAQVLKSYGHGEPDPGVARRLLENELGPHGELALMGVDGLAIANELVGAIQLAAREWQPVHVSDEAAVFHRPGQLSPRVRSIATHGGPFLPAKLDAIVDARNYASVELDASSDTTVVFTRPWFSGYRAYLNGKSLGVQRFRGVVPAVNIPAGSKGTLKLVFRPRSLVIGVAVALTTALAMGIGTMFAPRRKAIAEPVQLEFAPILDASV